jgi:hypothetical protein
MENINTNLIQYFAAGGSTLFLFFIIELVRRRKIREQYAILWIVTGVLFLFFAIWRDALNMLSYLLGIAYPPAAFLLILIMGIFLILIQFSVVISDLSEKIKILIQEIAFLRLENEKLKKK